MASPPLETVGLRPTSTIRWRVVMTNKHGYHLLHELTILPSDRGLDVVRNLVKDYKEAHWLMSWLMNVVPFMRPVFYRVTLSQVPIEDISANFPCPVDVEPGLSRCDVLAMAARNTNYLPDIEDFLRSYSHFAVEEETPGSTPTRDALLVRLELNKLILLVFVVTSIILSVGFGVLAGFCQRSLDTGLGVFGAVLGLIGIVEGFLTWLLK